MLIALKSYRFESQTALKGRGFSHAVKINLQRGAL